VASSGIELIEICQKRQLLKALLGLAFSKEEDIEVRRRQPCYNIATVGA
jgi:hypothetical protein